MWLGLLQLSQLGALVIPLPKHSDAIAEVRALLRGDIFQKDRYQSILGLFEHLLVYANGDRSAMAFMHAPDKALQNAGPTAAVHISDDIKRQLVAWEARLAERAGIPAAAVFTRRAGLGATRAAMLSLHSGRVFCACALLAQGAPRPMILALCRWRDERSLDLYARPSAAEYLGWMTKVSVEVVDYIAPRNIPQLDYDEAARLANSFLHENTSPEDDG